MTAAAATVQQEQLCVRGIIRRGSHLRGVVCNDGRGGVLLVELEAGPDPQGYRLNNNWPSRLARHVMRNVPALAGFFETRELRS